MSRVVEVGEVGGMTTGVTLEEGGTGVTTGGVAIEVGGFTAGGLTVGTACLLYCLCCCGVTVKVEL